MLNGSWPVEQAADQSVSWRSAARRTTRSAMIPRRASKGALSRKNEVSCVIIAQSTSFSSDGSVPCRIRSIRVSRLGIFRWYTIGISRATTRYCFVSSMHTPVRFRSRVHR